MNPRAVCSHCLRSLRRNAVAEKLPQLSNARNLSTTPARWQEQRHDSGSKPYTAPPPITTGTVTANITAAPPEAVAKKNTNTQSKSPPSIPTTSTSEMQRQISANLSQSSGSSLAMNLAQKLRKTAKSTTESYITYGVTEAYFKSCNAQADYTIPEEQRNKILTDKPPPKTADGVDLGIPQVDSWWFTELGLEPTFSTWSQVAYLHMYLLTVRLRAMETSAEFTNYQRYLIEHFSNAAEDKMLILHNMNARGVRNKYLKDLFLQWRGVLAAYDEGLVKGDAVLGSAVWRNLWKGSEDVDWVKVALVVAYMRRCIVKLGNIELEEIVHNLNKSYNVWHAAKQDVSDSLGTQSSGINEPLTASP